MCECDSSVRGIVKTNDIEHLDTTYAHVCSRMLTYAHVCSRMLTYEGKRDTGPVQEDLYKDIC